MDRKVKEVALPGSGYIAHVVQELTYGENNEIQGVFMIGATTKVGGETPEIEISGEKIMEYNKKKLLICVKKLEDGAGKELPVIQKTFDNLPIQDGTLLEAEVDKVIEAAKKK